jgi:hypothetical protein
MRIAEAKRFSTAAMVHLIETSEAFSVAPKNPVYSGRLFQYQYMSSNTICESYIDMILNGTVSCSN